MKVTLDNKTKELVIRIPAELINPLPSTKGKTLVVATSSGFQGTTIEVKGSPLKVSVNAIIPNPNYAG